MQGTIGLFNGLGLFPAIPFFVSSMLVHAAHWQLENRLIAYLEGRAGPEGSMSSKIGRLYDSRERLVDGVINALEIAAIGLFLVCGLVLIGFLGVLLFAFPSVAGSGIRYGWSVKRRNKDLKGPDEAQENHPA